MANLSGSYSFGQTQSDQLIVDAYERIGILPDEITAQQINSAQRTANLLLSEWLNKGLNAWTVTLGMLNLIPRQNAYLLPAYTSNILTATIRTSTRQLGGTPFSSAGGVAANAFDGNSAIACTQIAPDGFISYNYGASIQYAIAMVGVQSNVTVDYTLTFDYSNDNLNWFTVLAPAEQTYTVGQNVWFVIPVPTFGQYFRVKENGGAILNVQELYFNTTLNDTVMTGISESEYDSLPVKNQTGKPSSYWFDRQIQPIIRLWPTPTQPYNNMYYSFTRMLQDVGQLTNLCEIPQRFYEALCAGLAVKLCMKYRYEPNKYMALKEAYQESFDLAAREDASKVPMRIFGDYSSGWGGQP